MPVLSLSYALGDACVGLVLFGLELFVSVQTLHTNVDTTNVIATSKLGDATNQIVVGSHLDSVPAGPGIDDNGILLVSVGVSGLSLRPPLTFQLGSGSAVNLELAVQYAKYSKKNKPENQVRFCWWAAEEEGLLGSTYYVANLTPERKQAILALLSPIILQVSNCALSSFWSLILRTC